MIILKINKVLIAILLISVFAVGTITFTDTVSAAVKSVDNENKDFTIESKEKTSKVKITWDANGGKIKNKKTEATTVNKGKKIGKLLAAPKLTGHKFKGWYTKKSGGTKISTNTKINKKMTLYAQWDRKISATEKKLIGTWRRGAGYNSHSYVFNKVGTFIELDLQISSNYGGGPIQSRKWACIGRYSVTGNTIYFTDRYIQSGNGGFQRAAVNTTTMKISLGSDEKGQYMLDEKNNLKFYKE